MSSSNAIGVSAAQANISRTRTRCRRDFIKSTGALLTSAALFGYDLRAAIAEPAPEITRIRLVQSAAICLAPEYLAEELLRLEGFSQVDYVAQLDNDPDPNLLVATGRAD